MLTAGEAIPRLDDYITDVTVSKRRGDSWVKVNEITSGHNVRIDLKYTLPEGLITSQSRKIQYQLPDVIKIDNPPLEGVLKDSSEQPVHSVLMQMVLLHLNIDRNLAKMKSHLAETFSLNVK